MTKTVVTPLCAAIILAVSTCLVSAQTGNSCNPCFPSYQQFCQQNYCNSCVGQSFFTDKTVRPFCHGMASYGDPCALGCGNGAYLGRLLGRSVPCAGPDFGYVYRPGLGANGQGLAPGWGGVVWGNSTQSSYSPSYTYRSPRDFLNPNPPSIGY